MILFNTIFVCTLFTILSFLLYFIIKNYKPNSVIESENDMLPGYLSDKNSLVYKGETTEDISRKIWERLSKQY